ERQAGIESHAARDIVDGIEAAQQRGWSIISRGGGTSVAGNAIGTGLIIDTSRYFNRILDIDVENRMATVEPGVVCDGLRDAGAEFGRTYGPDPSKHSRGPICGTV